MKQIKFKPKKKSIYDSLISISRKDGDSLLKSNFLREITKEVNDYVPFIYRYWLLKDGRVIRNDMDSPPEPPNYYIFASVSDLENFYKLVKLENDKLDALNKFPNYSIEGSYGVSKGELDSLINEDQFQLSEYLNLPLENLDYTMESLNKIDKKLEGLEQYKIEQIVQLLNIYGCKVLAKSNNGVLFTFETPFQKYSVDVKINNKRYNPLYNIAKELSNDITIEGFSLYFSVRYAPIIER